jgi:hypothetical protein
MHTFHTWICSTSTTFLMPSSLPLEPTLKTGLVFTFLTFIYLFLKRQFCLFVMVIQGVSLWNFLIYLYYTLNWFFPSIILLSTLVPFLWRFQQVWMLYIHTCIESTWTIFNFTFFIYSPPPISALPLAWHVLHSCPSLFRCLPVPLFSTCFLYIYMYIWYCLYLYLAYITYMRENMWPLAFWIWLTSLEMFFSSIHLLANNKISFFFIIE